MLVVVVRPCGGQFIVRLSAPNVLIQGHHHIYCGARQVGYKEFWLTFLKKIKYNIKLIYDIQILYYEILQHWFYEVLIIIIIR